MCELIEHIPAGLALEIRETPTRRLMNMGVDGYSGNIVAIALAGKLGRRQAQKRIELALKPGMNRDKAVQTVVRELGLTLEQCECLAAAHLKYSAMEIVGKLKAGWTLDALSSHVEKETDQFDQP